MADQSRDHRRQRSAWISTMLSVYIDSFLSSELRLIQGVWFASKMVSAPTGSGLAGSSWSLFKHLCESPATRENQVGLTTHEGHAQKGWLLLLRSSYRKRSWCRVEHVNSIHQSIEGQYDKHESDGFISAFGLIADSVANSDDVKAAAGNFASTPQRGTRQSFLSSPLAALDGVKNAHQIRKGK